MKSDVVFVLDSSSTICPALSGSACANWTNVLTLVSKIVDQMTIDQDQTRVGVVQFGSKANSVFYLSTYSRFDANIDTSVSLDGICNYIYKTHQDIFIFDSNIVASH